MLYKFHILKTKDEKHWHLFFKAVYLYIYLLWHIWIYNWIDVCGEGMSTEFLRRPELPGRVVKGD